MGRPPKEIDPNIVRRLASLGCSYREIASVVGCAHSVIHERFRTEVEKGQDRLRRCLRRWQLKAAKAGNVAMMIWLGKQYLGQSDKQEVETNQHLGLEVRQDIAALRQQLQKDQDYLDFVRGRTGKGHGDARGVGGNGEPVVETGEAPRLGGPGPNGNGDGRD